MLTGEDWADGKERPNLNQGLQTFSVDTIPVAEETPVDWDDDNESQWVVEARAPDDMK
jgi:hypothetical protein